MIGSEFNLQLNAEEQKYLEEKTLHAELQGMQANKFTQSQQEFMQNFNPAAVDASKEKAILAAAIAKAKESVNVQISAVRAHMEDQGIFSILEAQAEAEEEEQAEEEQVEGEQSEGLADMQMEQLSQTSYPAQIDGQPILAFYAQEQKDKEKRAPEQKSLLDSLYRISNKIFLIELEFTKEASFLRTFEQLTNLVHQASGVSKLYELRFGATENAVMALAMREQHREEGGDADPNQVDPLPVTNKPKPLKRSMGTASFANIIVTSGDADEKIIDTRDRIVYHAPPKGWGDFLPWRKKKRQQEILRGQAEVDARNLQIYEENRLAEEENKNIVRRNMLREIARKKILLEQNEGIIDAVSKLKNSSQDVGSRSELNAINTAADSVILGLSKLVSKQTFTKQSEDVLKVYNTLVAACTAHKTEHPGSKNKDLVKQILSIAKNDIAGIKKAVLSNLGSDENTEMTFMTALERAVRTERIDLTDRTDVKRVGAAASTRLEFTHNHKKVYFTQEDVLQDYPGIMTPVLDSIMAADYEERVRILEDETAAEPELFTEQAIGAEQAHTEEPALFIDDEQTQGSTKIDILIYKEKVKAIVKGMEDFAKNNNYTTDAVNIFADAGDAMKGADFDSRIERARHFFGIYANQNLTTKSLKYTEGITLSKGEWNLFANDLADLLVVYSKARIQRNRLLNVGDNITVRNAAMSRVAELLGAGDLLARSTTAEVTIDGKTVKGNLMEAAHGHSPIELKDEFNRNFGEYVEDYNTKREQYNADKKAYEDAEIINEIERRVERRYASERTSYVSKNRSEPSEAYRNEWKAKVRESVTKKITANSLKHPFEELEGVEDRINELREMQKTISDNNPQELIANVSMQRNMVRLQILDTLCMQTDRHLNNYFISPKNANENQLCIVEGIDNDLAFLPIGDISGFGYNLPNFVRPDGTTTLSAVDAEMADAILALTPATLLLAVGDSIPEEERTALTERLEKMQDALIKTKELRPRAFIEKYDWSLDTFMRLKGKQYNTYFRALYRCLG
jgi:hypothetical protein